MQLISAMQHRLDSSVKQSLESSLPLMVETKLEHAVAKATASLSDWIARNEAKVEELVSDNKEQFAALRREIEGLRDTTTTKTSRKPTASLAGPALAAKPQHHTTPTTHSCTTSG